MADWVKDDSGNIITGEDGNPQWKYDSGDAVPVIFGKTLESLSQVSGENKNLRNQIKEGLEKLKTFEGIDPETARKNAETVLNIDEKTLIAAGERDSAVQAAVAARDAHWGTQVQAYEEKVTGFEQTISQKDSDIRETVLSSDFAKSPFLKNDTRMTSDVAEAIFGKNYDVEKIDGKLVSVAKDSSGSQMFAPSDPSRPATHEEALKVFFSNYIHKEDYLKTAPAGPGSRGADNSGKKINPNKSLSEEYKEMGFD